MINKVDIHLIADVMIANGLTVMVIGVVFILAGTVRNTMI